MNQKTEGIVIKRTNFGEADRILTILTERFGKIKVIAKGVRKISSRLAGSLEPFMLLDLQLHEGKTFYIVTGAVIKNEFINVHTELKKTSEAFYIAELIDKFVEENQHLSGLFELFFKALKSIEDKKTDFYLRVFELKLIEKAGFYPELRACIHCRKKLTPSDNFWDSIEGGVICQDCQERFRHGQKITDQLIKLFRFIERENVEKIENLKISENLKQEAEEILTDYIKSILEKELKSKKFMKDLK